jgi:hypothetical protein
MEGQVGYQCRWELRSVHIGLGFANDLIKTHILWNEPIRQGFEHFKVFYV